MANMSRTKRDTVERKTALQTAFSTAQALSLVNFGPQWKIAPEFRPT